MDLTNNITNKKLLFIYHIVLALETRIRHSLVYLSENSSEENTRTLSSDFLPRHATRSVVENIRTLEKTCFI